MDRETLRRIFAEQGFDINGASPHSWRCDYPDRYGDCTCVDEMIDAVLGAEESVCCESCEKAKEIGFTPSSVSRKEQ